MLGMMEDTIPDSMTRTTSNVRNRHVDATRSDGNTVVANTDVGGCDVDIGGLTDMNAISVLTIPRSCNVEPRKMNIVTPIEGYMKALAVHKANIAHCRI